MNDCMLRAGHVCAEMLCSVDSRQFCPTRYFMYRDCEELTTLDLINLVLSVYHLIDT